MAIVIRFLFHGCLCCGKLEDNNLGVVHNGRCDLLSGYYMFLLDIYWESVLLEVPWLKYVLFWLDILCIILVERTTTL